jgi:hypothetical protein
VHPTTEQVRERRALGSARAVLAGGRRGVADVGGLAVELRAVVPAGPEVLGLAATGLTVPTLDGCTDVPGDLRVEARSLRDGPVRLHLVGWWRALSTVEVVGRADALLAHVPYAALADPAGWVERAVLLALDVAGGTVTAGEHRVALDDLGVREHLLG